MTDAEINKAVAEIDGYSNVIVSDGSVIGVEFNTQMHEEVPDYANSLDAIVPVVREWCATRLHQEHNWGIGGTTASGIMRARVLNQVEHDNNPARALCFAFLQAVKETP